MIEDDKIYEKIAEDMQDIEIPDRLSPLKMMEKIKKVKPDRKAVRFGRVKPGVTSRVASAGLFLGVSVAVTALVIHNSNGAKDAEAVSEVAMTMATTAEESACDEAYDAEYDDTAVEAPAMSGGLALANAGGGETFSNVLEIAKNGADSIGRFTRASGYDELYEKYFYDGNRFTKENVTYDGDIIYKTFDDMAVDEEDVSIEANLMQSADGMAAGTNYGDVSNEMEDSYYTDTITQVEGISEADVIKTDGDNLYILYNGQIKILKADDLSLQAVIDPFAEENRIFEEAREAQADEKDIEPVHYWGWYDAYDRIDVKDMYLSGNTVFVIGVERTSRDIEILDMDDESETDGETSKDTAMADCEVGYPRYRTGVNLKTIVKAYDVAEACNPSLKYEATQDGEYNTSRMADGRLYLMTHNYKYNYFVCYDKEVGIEPEYLDEWVPKVNGCMIPSYDMYVTEDDSSEWTMIASFDTATGDVIDSKVLYDWSSNLYMTNDSIYIYTSKWSDEENPLDIGYKWYNMTEISKFSLDEGNITAEASAVFPGNISDTFAIHEAGDYTYILLEFDGQEITEDEYDYKWRTFSKLYVVDKDLNTTGMIDNIAEDEYVYSARFFGNIGYFVTYRNMDPLFAVDLSDPTNPTIIGELEMPGFSEYLQPWGDNLLLGIGEERDKDSRFIGFKLSLFDISDPVNMVEVDKLVVENGYSESEYDYKKLLADVKTGLIGMTVNSWGYTDNIYEYKRQAYVFRVVDNKFVKEAEIPLNNDDYWYYYGDNSYRLVYIDNNIYVMDNNVLRAFDTTNQYEEVASFEFEEIEDDGRNWMVID